MQLIEGQLVFSASDLTGYLDCEHLTQLELSAVRGERARPNPEDPELEVISRRGVEHERRYLAQLRSSGLRVAGIQTDELTLPEAAELTTEAMRSGEDVIYQAAFFNGRWAGYADFLRRTDTPSNLGPYSYEVEDTKLARYVKASALLQVCAYSDWLEAVQGRPPQKAHIVLGNGSRRSFALNDYAAYFRAVRSRFEEVVAGPPLPTYQEPTEHCTVCRWREVCEQARRDDDHLSLVAGMRRDQARKLAAAGIRTVAGLAASAPGGSVAGIGQPTLEQLRHQARLQVEQRDTGQMTYELLAPEAGRGLCALPEPMGSDLFFDMEGDPFAAGEGLEYLFGIAELVDGKLKYHSFWAHHRAAEKKAFESLIDFIIERLDANPNLHVYHYASYEPSALKRLMGLHATREQEVDRLLRGGVLVDLYRVVCHGVRVSADSYSLKAVEPLYLAKREGAITDASSSMVAYEEWLETGSDPILEDIADYNRADCISLWELQKWLEGLREDAERQFGVPVPRPERRDAEPSEALAEAEEATRALIEGLTAGVPDDPVLRSEEQQARWLLAQLLGWHRREAKSQWWAYFARLEMTDTELVEDTEAIGELKFEGVVERVKRSAVYRYSYPEQDHKIADGDIPVNPVTGETAGTVVDVDVLKGTIDLKRSLKRELPHPRSIIPGSPINTTVLRQALARVAEWVIENGVDASGPYRAVRDLLLARPPRVQGLAAGESPTQRSEAAQDAAMTLVSKLEDACLPVQGPPGSGKTYMGADVILDLIRQGRRVGIAAHTHKAISNLLDEALEHAQGTDVAIRAIQKAGEDEAAERVKWVTNKNEEVEAAVASGAVDLVAGTAWLFAREAFEESLDYLFVDEAGQMSLANVVAIGGAARNLILLGDPRQLAQPSQGSHPPGAERSALEHLLGERATIPPDRGLFLERTWRMHPDVCTFISEVVYERRLQSHPSCAIQTLADGSLGGTGLRFLPIVHEGNRTSSTEEAERVAAELKALLGREWTDCEGQTRPLTFDDILVVAPYNAQVSRLAIYLPGARIGTVDKFQGQEAPVVFFSMATSSPEDMPRGMDFLYSLNRLNVAISRARGLAILVCSPALLRVRCRTPEEMRLANAFCRLVEMAGRVHEGAARGR